MTPKKAFFLILLILILDQCSKFYIKTHFELHEKIIVWQWFHIVFVENEGMAWGTKISDVFTSISDRTAKLSLTLFRVFAIFGIGYWLLLSIKKKQSKLLIIAISLIFSGALGNIIDSVFYGVVFEDSYNQVAQFLPLGGGYESIFHGKVVDMLHFPIWKGVLPEWIPWIGGNYFTFFQPVFNIADMAISTGIGMLIIFNTKTYYNLEEEDSAQNK